MLWQTNFFQWISTTGLSYYKFANYKNTTIKILNITIKCTQTTSHHLTLCGSWNDGKNLEVERLGHENTDAQGLRGELEGH